MLIGNNKMGCTAVRRNEKEAKMQVEKAVKHKRCSEDEQREGGRWVSCAAETRLQKLCCCCQLNV